MTPNHQQLIRGFFLYLCRLAALLAVILAIKVWIENPPLPAPSSPMNAIPALLQANLGPLLDRSWSVSMLEPPTKRLITA